MDIVRAVAIFCEDIREEKSGQDILVGLISDNLGVESFPAMLSKLGVYMRVYFDPTTEPAPFSGFLRLPWSDQIIGLGEADRALMEKSFREAKANGNVLAGIILKGIFSPLPVPSPGKILAYIKIGDDELLCGALNIAPNPSQPSPTALPPPS